MKQLVGPVAVLWLVSAVCGLLPGAAAVPTPTANATQSANPLPEALTEVALTASPTPSKPSEPTPLPTPVTTFTTATTSEVFGTVTVVTTAETTRYALLGETANELDFYMRTLGPMDSTGGHWFALTDPHFDWRYPCSCDDAGCVTGPVTVYVHIAYTIPIWEPPPEAPPDLVDRWNFFQRALVLHERGHGDLASTCGRQLGEAFVALPPQATCEAVDSAVQAASEPVFAECRAAQSQYEEETNHGQRDGVVWPP